MGLFILVYKSASRQVCKSKVESLKKCSSVQVGKCLRKSASRQVCKSKVESLKKCSSVQVGKCLRKSASRQVSKSKVERGVQVFKSTSLQVDKCSSRKSKVERSVQVFKLASVQVCKSTSLQVNKSASRKSKEVLKLASVQVLIPRFLGYAKCYQPSATSQQPLLVFFHKFDFHGIA